MRSAPLTNPQRMFCGVAVSQRTGHEDRTRAATMEGANGDEDAQELRYVHIMFAYAPRMAGEVTDDSMQLFYKIPLREEL